MKHSLKISKADFEIARYRKDTEVHRKVQQRLHMIYLNYKGYTQTEIADILGVNRVSIWRWSTIYEEGGLASLSQLNYKGQASELHRHKELIKQSIESAKPRTREEIRQLVGKKNRDLA